MNANFSRTLSLLRKERGISQRKAAAAMGVSQALLSHYENGIREPGLSFVVRACDYYNVSADFLLGRTLNRDGGVIQDADSLYDASRDRDDVLHGSVMATLAKKLLINSISVLFDLLGRLGSKPAIRAAANYLSTDIYVLFRYLHRASPDGNEDFFALSKNQFLAGLPRADMIMTGAEYLDALTAARKDKSVEFPPMSHNEMSAAYPGSYQSLLQIIHSCGARLTGEAAAHREHSR